MSDAPDLDGTYRAVLDRFEGDQAVLVVEDDGESVAEVLADRASLPEQGNHQDAVFYAGFDHGEIVDLAYDRKETSSRKNRAQSRFNRLSKRLPRDDDSE